MTTGSLLLALALLLLVALFVARPFLLPPQRPPRLSRRQVLEAEKEALLARIRALDFDAQTGKQDIEAYEAERAYLMAQAADILAQLAESAATDPTEEIETAVARLRDRVVAATVYCPQCGRPVGSADKFCANCGEALT